LKLRGKWGCDGSSGYNDFMQKKSTDAGSTFSETSIFIFSYVPLRLTCLNKDFEEVELWINPRPSSVTYCRPMKLLYIKENKENTEEEFWKTQREINELKPFYAVNG